MPTTHGPLFALTAQGSIGDVLTYQHRPGGTLTRHKPDQAAPSGAAQEASRRILPFLRTWWELRQSDRKTYWEHIILARNLTPWTTFVHSNAGALSRNHNTRQFLWAPAQKGMPYCRPLTLQLFSDAIEVITAGSPTPPGYTASTIHVLAWADLDPSAIGATFPAIFSTTRPSYPVDFNLRPGHHGSRIVVTVFRDYISPAGITHTDKPAVSSIQYP